MTNVLTWTALYLSAGASVIGRWPLAPIGSVPGWLSATVAGIASGIALLAVFKYTSNQAAIKRARDDINAQLLALKLFKDSAWVSLKAQGRILRGAGALFALAIVPILVMALPVTLLLAQLGLWYQARPLHVGEDAVIVLKLAGAPGAYLPAVDLRPTAGVEVTVGPVRVPSRREVCWNVRPSATGSYTLEFQLGDQVSTKQIAVGEGFMRVSQERPGWDWPSILLNPWERPFPAESPVQSIQIDYPPRSSWISGTDHWVIYWFAVSMVAALCFRRALGVYV
jgi:hypothetical protein